MTSGEELGALGEPQIISATDEARTALESMLDVAREMEARNPNVSIPAEDVLRPLKRLHERWRGITEEVKVRHIQLIDILEAESIPDSWRSRFTPEEIETGFAKLRSPESIIGCIDLSRRARAYMEYVNQAHSYSEYAGKERYRFGSIGVIAWMNDQLSQEIHSMCGITEDIDNIEPLSFMQNEAVVVGFCQLGEEIETARAIRGASTDASAANEKLLDSPDIIEEHQAIIAELEAVFEGVDEIKLVLNELREPYKIPDCIELARRIKAFQEFRKSHDSTSQEIGVTMLNAMADSCADNWGYLPWPDFQKRWREEYVAALAYSMARRFNPGVDMEGPVPLVEFLSPEAQKFIRDLTNFRAPNGAHIGTVDLKARIHNANAKKAQQLLGSSDEGRPMSPIFYRTEFIDGYCDLADKHRIDNPLRLWDQVVV
jgi:hypothetical protein